MRIPGTEPSSVILSQTMKFKKLKKDYPKLSKQAEISSSDRKATVTNQMHCNDLEAYGKKCNYFWFRFKIKFLTRFWRLLAFLRINL